MAVTSSCLKVDHEDLFLFLPGISIQRKRSSYKYKVSFVSLFITKRDKQFTVQDT